MNSEMKLTLKNLLSIQFPSTPALHQLFEFWAKRGAPFAVAPSPQANPFETDLTLEEALVLSVHWGRTEWRLLEGVLVWLWDHWRLPHPSQLNSLIRLTPQPASWGILSEWTHLRSEEMTQSHKAFWILVTENIGPASGEMFFREGKILNSERTRHMLIHTLPLYEKWGFVCDQLPSISQWKRMKWETPSSVRERVLRNLLKQGEVTLSLYLQALNHSVSRQTAWRDLRSLKRVSARGRTRSRRYISRSR